MTETAQSVGVICSSGGSAYLAALACLPDTGISVSSTIVVDRPCGMFNAAQEIGLPVTQIHYRDRQQYSRDVAIRFSQAGCTRVILFYSRLVDPLEFECRGMSLHNIHPSLLPAFPGMNAVHKSHRHGARMVGATLHVVDNGIDTGSIEAQVAVGVPLGVSLAAREHLSFLQKTYLTLVWFEMALTVESGAPFQPLGHAVGAGSMGLAHWRLADNYLRFSQASRPVQP